MSAGAELCVLVFIFVLRIHAEFHDPWSLDELELWEKKINLKQLLSLHWWKIPDLISALPIWEIWNVKNKRGKKRRNFTAAFIRNFQQVDRCVFHNQTIFHFTVKLSFYLKWQAAPSVTFLSVTHECNSRKSHRDWSHLTKNFIKQVLKTRRAEVVGD